MEIEAALAFVREHHHGVFATVRADGGTAMSPVVAGVDLAGKIVVSTRQTARKVTHVRRSGRAALVVFTDRFFGPWVQVEGPVSVVELPAAMEGLVAYYREISGEHPDWDDYRGAMEREQRVLLQMTVERAGPTSSG